MVEKKELLTYAGAGVDVARELLTYAGAGVDVARGEKVIDNLGTRIISTWNNAVVPNVSGFKGVYDHGDDYLIGATDGVGTKLLVAIKQGDLTTVGQDLVAMCVNDISRVGGRVLFFLDYLATGKLEERMHRQILDGIVEGCKIGGFPLLGGETAEMPGMYEPGHFDLAGFAVGEVRKDRLLTGAEIQPGMSLLGIESSGIHSNGLSLARKIFFDKLGLDVDDYVPELETTVGRALLQPTLIYTQAVQDLLEMFPGQIQGMAHITGGGILNKLPKALPQGLGAEVQEGSWPIHPIFDYMAEKGPVSIDEMCRTFNMGLGMVAVVEDKGAIPEMQSRLSSVHKLKSYDIGKVVEGEGVEYV